MASDKVPILNPGQQYPPSATGPPPPVQYHGAPSAPQQQYGQQPQGQSYHWGGSPVVSQPQIQHQQNIGPDYLPPIPRVWSSGLCQCCKKPGSCLLYCFCPCVSMGLLARRMGSSFLYGFCCGRHLETISRPYIRARHNITGDFCDDCLVATMCGPCSVCQIDRELDKLGYP